MKRDFNEIIAWFDFEGEFISAHKISTGHIHDTYCLHLHQSDLPCHYILQCINQKVFKDTEGLMKNIESVTTHLKRKIAAAGGDPKRETLTLIPTIEGKSYYRTSEGDVWRVYLSIENARTHEVVKNLQHVTSAARAFGKFQNLLSDFPIDQLFVTIPDFHNTAKRYKDFVRAVEQDRKNLAYLCKPEIDFILERAGKTTVLLEMLARGELTERITHNDTKFDNVMIDNATGEGICVIDLDTVMPGLSLYDFGDSIRSMANPVAEDERDLSKVQFNMKVFERFTRGYLETARDFLTPLEIELLPFSAILMTLECGMRFLTDHLQGDIYFKVNRANHNLDRCRTQFKLIQDMETKYDEMSQIVEKYR